MVKTKASTQHNMNHLVVINIQTLYELKAWIDFEIYVRVSNETNKWHEAFLIHLKKIVWNIIQFVWMVYYGKNTHDSNKNIRADMTHSLFLTVLISTFANNDQYTVHTECQQQSEISSRYEIHRTQCAQIFLA